MDSTLNNITDLWLAKYNKDYNDNLTNKDLKAWEINEFVKPECGMKIFDYILQPNFFIDLDLYDLDAPDVVEWLKNYAEVYIVTAYHPYVCKDKADWIAKYLPKFNQRNIIFCNQKHLLELDYLIDDNPHTCEQFKGQYILMDYPWNKSLGDKYPRMENWLQVQEYFIKKFN